MSTPFLLQSTRNDECYYLGNTFRIGTHELHEATRVRDQHRCWVKHVPADDDAAIARLRYEAIILDKLTHDRIIHLCDRGRTRQCFFLVLQPVPGRSLLRLIEAGPLPVDHVVHIGVQLANVLVYLHQHGIICRTLSPDMFYVDHLANLSLITLRAARDEVAPPHAAESVTQAKYLSPEEAGGLVAERRSDMYGYGLLLFELLTGRPPFASTNRGDLALQHLLSQPPAVAALRPDTLPELAELVRHCLAKAPAQRPADAQTLRAAITHIGQASLDEAVLVPAMAAL